MYVQFQIADCKIYKYRYGIPRPANNAGRQDNRPLKDIKDDNGHCV